MTTDSNPQKLVLIFSTHAAELYKTFRVRMKNGEIHEFNRTLDASVGYDEGYKIIPYMWNEQTPDGTPNEKRVVEIDVADIELSRGTNEMPPLGQLVRKEETPEPRYGMRGKTAARPAPRPINPVHI